MHRWYGPFAAVRARDGVAVVAEESDARFVWSPSFDALDGLARWKMRAWTCARARVVGFARDDKNGMVSVRHETYGAGERTRSGFECVVLADKRWRRDEAERGDRFARCRGHRDRDARRVVDAVVDVDGNAQSRARGGFRRR